MNTTNIFLVLALFSVTQLMGQAEVGSKAYSFMLSGLLSHTVPEISTKNAVEEAATTVFLDARESHEYQVSHIKDAIFVGYDKFDMQTVLDHVPKSKKVVVYCSVGYRSEKISEQLLAQGYQDVSNLYGGIFEWKNSGYPVYKDEKETKEVHAYDRVWGLWLKKGEKVYGKP